jgi:hypothetical protein
VRHNTLRIVQFVNVLLFVGALVVTLAINVPIDAEIEQFQFTRPFALTAIGNTLALWNREELGLELAPGVDEVTLVLVADAWSRTYRSRAVTWSPREGAIETLSGLRVRPDRIATDWRASHLLPPFGERSPASALDAALDGISARYGARTADFVAMQLEYPRS